jgi:hypothetical protein
MLIVLLQQIASTDIFSVDSWFTEYFSPNSVDEVYCRSTITNVVMCYYEKSGLVCRPRLQSRNYAQKSYLPLPKQLLLYPS